MDDFDNHRKGLLITALGVLLLTPDSLLVRLIATDPWTMVFWRGSLLMVALLAFQALARRGRLVGPFRAIGRAGLLVAALFAASSVLFVFALAHTSVANTLIIVSAAPLFAALLSRFFLAEPVPLRTWVAILVSFAGLLVVVAGDLGSGGLAGNLAALGTAFAVAGTTTTIRHARSRSMLPAMTLSGGLSALIAAPLAAPLALDAGQGGYMLLLGLLVLPLSFALLIRGPRYIPAPEVNLLLLLETVLGPLWVWLVISEQPSRMAWIGGAVVVAALMGHSALALKARAPSPALSRADGPSA
jgi:drug/metabolite transporter (DMT)-like permease